MEIAIDDIGRPQQPPPRKGLPPRMRVLFISSRRRTGRWLAEALDADAATQIHLEEAVSPAAGLALLRDEPFDALLLVHDPPEIDALDFIEAFRGSTAENPVIVLGEAPRTELESLVLEVGADAYCRIEDTSVRALNWTIARAVEHAALLAANHRLGEAERQRREVDHQEAARLLRHQRSMIDSLDSLSCGHRGDDAAAVDSLAGSDTEVDLPEHIRHHYRDLLRTYVIMGSGNLAGELAAVAELLVQCGASGRHVAYMHLSVLEEIVGGLGNRSGRHVINRADLLALELLVHLTEIHRRHSL